MQLSTYLKAGFICLDMLTSVDPPDEEDYDQNQHVMRVKRAVLTEVTDLFEGTGRVDNRNKLFTDLWNREKKASTAVGHNIAMPHIRSKKVREVMIGFGRSHEGFEFGAPDGEKVHFIIAIIGSAFEPDLYLKVYRRVADLFRYDGIREQLYETWSESDVYRMFDGNF